MEVVDIMEILDEQEAKATPILDKDGWYPDHTRRVAVLWIPEDILMIAMMWFLTGELDNNEFGFRLLPDCIPKGVKVLRTTQSWDRQAIGFLLSHTSFDIVPEGAIPPDLTYSKLVWEFPPKQDKESFPTPNGYVKSVQAVDDKGIISVSFRRIDHVIFFSKEDK